MHGTMASRLYPLPSPTQTRRRGIANHPQREHATTTASQQQQPKQRDT